MENIYPEKGSIEDRIENCNNFAQQIAIHEFDDWLRNVGIWDNNQDGWSKIHFMIDELNLYNATHKYKLHFRNNKIIHFRFTGSCGEVDFIETDINAFLAQNEYSSKYSNYMHLLLSILTLGLHRRIIPWLINLQKRRSRKKIEELKHKVKTWNPENI